MIVDMKKITLLCVETEKASTLEELRNLGVLHLSPLKEPTGDDLEKVRARLTRAETALNILKSYSPPASDQAEEKNMTPEAVAQRVYELQNIKRDISNKIDTLHAEKNSIEPMGDFNPELVSALAEKGIIVKIYSTTSKEPIVPSENTTVAQIGGSGQQRIIAIIGKTNFEFDAVEIPIPERSLSAVIDEIEEADIEMSSADEELRNLCRYAGPLEKLISELSEELTLIEAREGMESSRGVAYLRGFCPVDLTDVVRKKAKEQGWGLIVEDPSDEDSVPTLIRTPSWVKPIKPMFKFLGITPGYKETDVSPAFLIFLSVFFAIIVGDAAYGMLLLLIFGALHLKLRKVPRDLFALFYIFSVSTVIWGAITGNYFGIAQEKLPLFLKNLRVGYLTSQDPQIAQANGMTFCLLIGAIHLSVAHLWNAFKIRNSTMAIAQLGWICVTWGMFLLSRYLLLEATCSPLWIALPACGLLAVILFKTPFKKLKEEWIGHALLLQDVIANFGDLVSYLRLFALGIAGVKVAEAFNEMAGMIGYDNVGKIIGAVAVMIFGHTLNLVLCGMSVLVHGVRLNALEFSMHMGQEWSGFEYRPFLKSNKLVLAQESENTN